MRMDIIGNTTYLYSPSMRISKYTDPYWIFEFHIGCGTAILISLTTTKSGMSKRMRGPRNTSLSALLAGSQRRRRSDMHNVRH